MNRYHNLDYLRGLAAFSIMIYHYLTWSYGVFDAGTFFGRIGLYGVSIFYILSGLTMALVYEKRMEVNRASISDFFIKRVFRIMPLLWLAIFLTYAVKSQLPPLNKNLLLNVTGLFGIIDCNISIARGGWSIGNEISFYLFFPFYLLSYKYSKLLFYVLSTAALAFYLWFAFHRIDDSATIESEWWKYINPLNQIFLFALGIIMAFAFRQRVISNKALLLLLGVSMSAFLFYPVTGERVALVTGINRLIFTVIMFLICLSFFKTTYELPKVLHKPLSILGETSYSVYLLHPIVWAGMERILKKTGIVLNASVTVAASIFITVTMSYFVYLYFEKYFVRLGKTTSDAWVKRAVPIR
jgi:exopolysaccharide production protein ExoZ